MRCDCMSSGLNPNMIFGTDGNPASFSDLNTGQQTRRKRPCLGLLCNTLILRSLRERYCWIFRPPRSGLGFRGSGFRVVIIGIGFGVMLSYVKYRITRRSPPVEQHRLPMGESWGCGRE